MTTRSEGQYVLEIAVHSLTSAIAASQSGADRIELCAALEVGGLTPDIGLIKQVLQEVSIPIHVLIRPRIGNFYYDRNEMRTIRSSIEEYTAMGVHGFVFGCLTSDDQIDVPVLQEVIEWAGSLPVVFHRAFDLVQDPEESLRHLSSLSITEVLTSGQQSTAWEGRDLLKVMADYKDGVTIIAGSGIHSGNLADLRQYTGITHFHTSAKAFQRGLSDEQHSRNTRMFGRFHDRDGKWESSEAEIMRMKSILDRSTPQRG